MTTQIKREKPSHEIRIGSIKAAIWTNKSQKGGTWYCVTFSRIYKSNGTWKRTHGFATADLPQVQLLARQAGEWIERQSNQAQLPFSHTPASEFVPASTP